MSDHAEFAVSVIDDQVVAGIPSIRKAVRVVVRVADARHGLIRTVPDCADHYPVRRNDERAPPPSVILVAIRLSGRRDRPILVQPQPI